MNTSPDKKPSLTPVILSVFSFATCCFPVGLIGAALGVRDVLQARRDGRAPAWQSLVAAVIGVLSLIPPALLARSYAADKQAGEAQRAGALQRAAAGKKLATLDAATACALAEAYLLETKGVGEAKVECKTAMVTQGADVMLSDVVLTRSSTTKRSSVCLTRAEEEWVVWGSLRHGVCPPAPTGVKGLEALRKSGAEAIAGAADVAWKKTVTELSVALSDEAPAACPAGLKGEVGVLDAEALMAKPEKSWAFLTSRALRNQLEAKGNADEALEALGAYVVLVEAEERSLPSAIKNNSFTAGYFAGRLVLVDVATKKALCAQPLDFENAETLKGGTKVGLKFLPKATVGGETPQGDFEARGRAAISKGVTAMGPGLSALW